jgi:hypothetical protein
VIAESPGTVFDRSTSSWGVLASACSRGIVISDSASSVDIPRPSVWISMNGGANSGKTSTGIDPTLVAPNTISAAAPAITRNRNFRLVPMIQRIIGGYPSGPGSLFELDLATE